MTSNLNNATSAQENSGQNQPSHKSWAKMDNAEIHAKFSELSGQNWQPETIKIKGADTAVISLSNVDSNTLVDTRRHLDKVGITAELAKSEDGNPSLKVSLDSVKTVQKKNFEKLDGILTGINSEMQKGR